MTEAAGAPGAATLREVEGLASELAREAGRIAQAALQGELQVDYKTESRIEGHAPRDPVSETDREIEALVRDRVAERFPAHTIIGEEVADTPDLLADFVWVIDPVDGTANFVNGFPLFCVSIGVLWRGQPVVGAIWCAATHALGPGIYHAHRGGGLSFQGDPFRPLDPGGVRRRLSAGPGGSAGRSRHWDTRVTGSAALELAFVAAGIFQSARFRGLHIWDLAAGVLLVEEAGGRVLLQEAGEFAPLVRFDPPPEVAEDRAPSLRDWRGFVLVGSPAAIEAIEADRPRPGWLARRLAALGLRRRSPRGPRGRRPDQAVRSEATARSGTETSQAAPVAPADRPTS